MDTDRESGYVPSIMDIHALLHIERATESHLETLATLLQAIEAEDHPSDAEAALRAPEGMRQSLRHFDWIHSDCIWILIAYVDAQPAGLAILTRIPKLDERLGFLYLDELHVLHPYRRRGVGSGLLQKSFDLAKDSGLVGVRLLTRPSNQPAHQLYESVGFQGNETMFYQRQFDRPCVHP